MKLISDFVLSAPVRFGLDKLSMFTGTLCLRQDPALPSQCYRRTCTEADVTIDASDDAGFLYGLLGLSDSLRRSDPLTDETVTPYLKNRGLKFNIPLDARTPSYSDASTSATLNIPEMWSMDFWTEFLDRMAENRYNLLSLWTLSPFPSLVQIPEYPEACLDDVKISARSFHADLRGRHVYDRDHHDNLITVKRMTIGEKIEFWRNVMQYAADRCVRVMIFTWNVFVYGTEDSPYGLTDAMDNPATMDFIRYGTRALLETYPLLAGLGVTTGENMAFDESLLDRGESSFYGKDVAYIRNTYGRGVEDYYNRHPDRKFVFIHRMQMSRYEEIIAAYRNFPCDFEISFKYSQAHMYSSTRPQFIAGFLKEKSPDVKVWLTVRNDDYYLYRWGNPSYAREYLENMPVSCLAGFYMGADGFTWGRDHAARGDGFTSGQDHAARGDARPLWIDKMWYMFRIWGLLSYDPALPDEAFRRELAARFNIPACQAEKLDLAWREVSLIIPELNCTHWHHYDFQWYPEGCCMYDQDLDKLCFANINEFVTCGSIPDGEYASVREWAEAKAAGKEPDRRSPEETVRSIQAHVHTAEALLPELESSASGKEYIETLKDIQAMALLGRYYALKETAAMALALYRITGDQTLQTRAVENLTEAAPIWKEYAAATVSRNIPQILARLCARVDLTEFNTYADMDISLAKEVPGTCRNDSVMVP